MSTSVASSGLFGQYERSKEALGNGETTDRLMKDKHTFLKLLITQLKHQDPLNPTEDKEFLAQLAQFTSVEELQNLNKGLEKVNVGQRQQQVASAASLLNKQTIAKGDIVTKHGKTISKLTAEFPDAVSEGTINVHSTREDGSVGPIIRSMRLGARSSGKAEINWDGTDNRGEEVADGSYVISIEAKRSNGERMKVDFESEGVIIGVKIAEDGNHELYLHDLRRVRYNDVLIITTPVQTQKDSKESSNGNKENGTKNESNISENSVNNEKQEANSSKTQAA